jgi:hypothetical protein
LVLAGSPAQRRNRPLNWSHHAAERRDRTLKTRALVIRETHSAKKKARLSGPSNADDPAKRDQAVLV